ncbi:MAG: putative transport system ATP-binding protein [Actinoplanes sp.]|jgi:ABC-type lipoprotein export system ATPase subunit|nr:putative transport system ATP-binding protein [Actinoplanes sp.]
MIVSARGIGVAFAGRAVLDGFSVQLDEGERCALTGRSGSGKTTLLLVLAGLLKPSAGTVDVRVERADLVYVPQAPSLVPELTALQNASLGLRIRGVAPDVAQQRGREQLRALGLDDTDEALPAELSGGMQQRVALARALAIAPRLLLADEPTGALDQATGARAVEVLNEYATRTGATVVVATHDRRVAARFPRQLAIVARTDKELVA